MKRKWLALLLSLCSFSCATLVLVSCSCNGEQGTMSSFSSIEEVISGSDSEKNSSSEESHTHLYDQEVAKDAYLKKSATCEYKAVYYKSCVCGEKGADTFEYGEIAEHAYVETTQEIAGTEYIIRQCPDCEKIEIESDNVIHPHNYVLRESYSATCTESGVAAWFECLDCDEDIIEEIAPLGHLPGNACYQDAERQLSHYSLCQRVECQQRVYESHHFHNWKVIEYYTCTKDGEMEGTCRDCDYVGTRTIEARCTWDDGVITQEAGCLTTGEKLYTCKICGKTKTKELSPLGHNWSEWEETVVPNCTKKGEATRTCQRCGESETETLLERHKYGEWVTVKEATCTQYGKKKHTCTLCGVESAYDVSPYHIWDDGTVTVQPTCAEDGEKFYKCTRCSQTKTEKIDAIGHDFQVQSQQDATCTQQGYIIKECTRCNEIDIIMIKALGHNEDYVYDENVHWWGCTRNCGYIIGEKETHALKVDYRVKEIVEGTKIVAYEHSLFYVCEVCDYEKNLGVIAHEHFATRFIEPQFATCLESGTTAGLVCGVDGCDDVLVAVHEIEALGHHWEKGNCLRCGETQLELTLSENGRYYIVTGMGDFTGTDLVIPSIYKGVYVTDIASYAISGDRLTNIRISDVVTNIESRAFIGVRGLTNIEVDADNTVYKSIDGNLYTKDGTTFLQYALGKTATSFKIPDGVTSIGSHAFNDCDSLQSIVISNSVEDIGSAAFYGCNNLSNIKILNDETILSYSVFEACNESLYTIENNLRYIKANNNSYCIVADVIDKSLATYEISSQTKYIEGELFYHNSSLTSIEIPNSVTSIGYAAFYNCDSLTRVIIGDGVIVIANTAFSDCNMLKEVVLGKSVKKIGEYSFGGCNSLESIEIPDSVINIGDEAFMGCNSLDSVTIVGGETNIGYRAFCDCKKLTSVILGYGVKNIGERAFEGCRNLQSVEIPSSVINIEKYAFATYNVLTIYCEAESQPLGWDDNWRSPNAPSSLPPVVWNCNYNDVADDGYIYVIVNEMRYGIKNGVAIVVKQSSTIISADIQSSIAYKGSNYDVTCIENYTFDDCTLLTSISIGKSVISIGDYVFTLCPALTEIIVDSENIKYKSADGNLYSKDGKTLIKYATGKKDSSFNISNSVTSIGSYAFYNCDSLTSIEIPNSVTSIGSYAFYFCRSLTSITYNGTMEKWQTVQKENGWNGNVPATYVQCSDGKVDL